MDSFYASLAEVTAAVIGLVAAVAFGYYLLVADRRLQLSEQTLQLTIEVSDELRAMPARVSVISLFIHRDFVYEYRQHYADTDRLGLALQSITDLIFRPENLDKALVATSATDPSLSSPTHGRVLLWAIAEITAVLTRGVIGDGGKEPRGVFPAAPAGPGYAAWEADYQRAYGATLMLRHFASPLLADFAEYAKSHGDRAETLETAARSTAQEFFASMTRLKAKVDEIQKRRTMLPQPAFSGRGVRVSLGVLAFVACVTGVLLPLVMLTLNSQGTVILARTLGAITFGCIVIGSVILVKGTQSGQSEALYTCERWYKPLVPRLQDVETLARQHTAIDIDEFRLAATTKERNAFPGSVAASLDNFVKAAEAYNQALFAINNGVLRDLRSDAALTALSEQGGDTNAVSVLLPELVLDPAATLTRLRSADARLALVITYVIPTSIHTVLRLRPNLADEQRRNALDALARLSAKIADAQRTELRRLGEDLVRAARHTRNEVERQIPDCPGR